MEGLAENQLLEKARISLQALDKMQQNIKAKFISIHILMNGGVIYGMNSVKVATWLQQLDVSKEFLMN
jgi:hypothetical protein